MALPFLFATMPAGTVPASDLDSNYNAVGAMGITQCTASGTNAITLTPTANQPPINAYAQGQVFGFIAAATSTGNCTLQVNALGFLNLDKDQGGGVLAPQAGPGDLVQGAYYLAIYDANYDSSGAGFHLFTNGSVVKQPTFQVFTTAGSPGYTPPQGTLYIWVRMYGGGGGGGGTGSSGQTAGGAGGTTTFGIDNANGGTAGGANSGASGGTGGGSSGNGTGSGNIRRLVGPSGFDGWPVNANSTSMPGGYGASQTGSGTRSVVGSAGGSPAAGSGAGGSGGGSTSTSIGTGAGGGAGEYVEFFNYNPAGAFTLTVGAGGTAGAAGTSGFAGGVGGSGAVIILEFYG